MMQQHRHWSLAIALSIGMALIPIGARAIDTGDTRLLSTPAIAEGKIAFVYADDIWVAGADGSNPRRLTSHAGKEQNPYFSPDGKHIAFTASYDGNDDVYVIPTEGGEPLRLTWHPGEDIVRGFTPDGKVLFSSQRAAFSRRHAQFYTVGIAGGVPDRLPIPTADKGAFSPDGKFLAYTPLGENFRQWKNYRGGTASRIWVLKLDDLSHEEIPKPAGGCNDTEPMWIGDTVYFLSDRDGEFNLYSYDRGSKTVARCTHHDSFPISSASAGAGQVIYEQAGWIHRFDPKDRESHRLKIGVAADLAETRPRYASGPKHIRNVGISPTGKRAVLEYRGEIVTVPAKKGDPHNLTATTGTHERSPAWSPDGKSIAYFSDATGEYQLVVRPQDGKGEGRSYPLKGSGFYEEPRWSPDSKKIAFIDNSRTLSWIDLATGAVKRIAAEPIYGPNRASRTRYNWSPDSKWLAYSLINRAGVPVDLALFDRFGQVPPPDRRPRGGRRTGLRPWRQVPLFPRLDRRRSRQQLVRSVLHRHAGDPLAVPGHARQGNRQSPAQGDRRGRYRGARQGLQESRLQGSGLQGEEGDGSGRTEGFRFQGTRPRKEGRGRRREGGREG